LPIARVEAFDFGAVASDYRYSESNHRGFYRRWAELMNGAGNGAG